MPFDFQQFQQKAEPPPGAFLGVLQFESDKHYPWSEPVRFRIVPRLRIALAVSGLFAPVLSDTQLTGTFESRWHYPWSEPVRLPKRLITGSQQFHTTFFDILPKPGNQIQGWFQEFRGPVWPRKGLRAYLQQTLAYHPRMLPPPNVTIIIPAIEINTDRAEFDIWAYDEPPVPIDLTAVNVSITEVPAESGGSVSITEDEP